MASVSNLSTDISALIQEYFQREALRERVFNNGLMKYAERSEIPKFYDRIAHFHKWTKFGLASDVAENADPASGQAANATEVKAALVEFADYIDIPNFGDAQRLDSLIKNAYRLFVEQAERTANRRVITAIDNGSSGSASFSAAHAIYSGNNNSFAELDPNSYLSNKDIQKAVAYLEQTGAPKINGSYKCLINPWSKMDLMVQDADFRNLIRVSGYDILKKGEPTMWAGASIEQQDEPFRETLGGTEGTYVAGGNVITTYVLGAQSIGITQLFGKKGIQPRFKVQDITKTGAVTSIGYRIPFAGIVLDPTWIVRIKSVVSDASVVSVA